MKRTYLFPIIFFVCFHNYSQSGCADAQAHIVYAFNNAKNSLEANNITHLKFYANKALEAFERVQSVLGTCNCETVENYTFESIQKLNKVPAIDKMHDAQYFVGKAKEYAQKSSLRSIIARLQMKVLHLHPIMNYRIWNRSN